MAEAPLLNQVLVLSGIALVVTVGVYGLVGVIVKIDDLGYWLAEKSSALMQALGKGLLIIAPWLMKALSIVGTLAMGLWYMVLRRCITRLNISPGSKVRWWR